MNEFGVLTTKQEIRNYVSYQYHFPKEECVFVGRLDNRNWFNKGSVYALECNFTTADGKKLALLAFRHKLPNEIYAPKDCDIDFAHDVEDDSIWKCTLVNTKFGNLYWKSAELVSQYDEDDSILNYTKIETYTEEQIKAALADRELRKQQKAELEKQREARRHERQYKKDLKANNWLGRRLRLVKAFRENILKPKQIKEYASKEICFVMTSDRSMMCCPKGIMFKTHDIKGKAKAIRFPESCAECEIKVCQGAYQKQLQLSYDAVTSSSMKYYTDRHDDKDEDDEEDNE